MRVKVLSRSDKEWSGVHDGTPNQSRASTNLKPSLHAPARPLEVQRALTAAKTSRFLARPFLFACSPSHVDGVYSIARSRNNLALFASAAADGEIRLWHLPSRSCRFDVIPKPAAFTRDITFSSDSSRLLACTDAKLVHSVSVEDPTSSPMSYQSQSGAFASISAHYQKPLFATASSTVQIWDENRSTPSQTLSLAVDSLHCVRFNPVEVSVVASAGSDRSVSLYDVRMSTPIRRLVLSMRTNDISWNPLEAFNFTIANDDHNCYTYDMRRLSVHGALTVHKDHVGAVMSVDYSPTGREFVTGSYDKTIRIFEHTVGRSREIYHTKRMQRVFAVAYTLDAGYVVSGSDDGDVRVWKSQRSRPVKPMLHREKEKVLASEKLIERYAGIPEIRRIAKKRHVPKAVQFMTKTKKEIEKSEKRKKRNVRRHTKKEKRERDVAESKKNIVRELE